MPPGIVAVHHGLRFACDGEGSAEQLVIAVQCFQPIEQIGVGYRQLGGRPGADLCRAAQHQRHVRPEGEAQGLGLRAAAGALSCAERDIEPAGLAAEGFDHAVLEQVLRIEVRALAVGRCDGVQHREFAGGEKLVHLRKMRVQAEVTVEIERAARRPR